MPGLRKWLPVILTSLCVGLESNATETPLELTQNGTSSYRIIIADDAIPSENTAARELSEYLQRISGATLPVKMESEAVITGKNILIGHSAQVKQMLPDIDFAKLKPDEIIIHTIGDTLILSGGRPRGTLYAVYTFLEKELGCRWWTSTDSSIPVIPSINIEPRQVRYAPQFMSREAHYTDPNQNPGFAAKLKLNGHFYKIPDELGGHYQILGWCHTFYQLLPPKKYFTAHPEWYSEIKGKRTFENAQLCLTNPEMKNELVKQALDWIAQKPHAGYISISQNDWDGRCTCAKCKELETLEGSPSGPLLRFVNSVATEITKTYPHMLIETLAYQYTRSPPKITKPGANVIIRLCSIECDFLRPLTSNLNRDFQKDLENWRRISPQLYIWDYTANFSQCLLPHPNLQVFGPNLHNFAANNVTAVFEQGDAYTTIGDFVRMKTWVLAHLLWNPQADADELNDEFLNGYYGAAAPYLKQYLELIKRDAETSNSKLSCYHLHDNWLKTQTMQKCLSLFAQALKAVAGDQTLQDRVSREQIPLLTAILDQGNYAIRRLEQNPDTLIRQLETIGNKWKNIHYAESSKCRYKDYLQELRRTMSPAKIPKVGLSGAAPNWIDFQENYFTLYNVSKVKDDEASNTMAAMIPKGNTDWAVQCELPGDQILQNKRWHCYAVIRASVDSGPIATFGLYDNRKHIPLAGKKIILPPAHKGYYTVDLGVMPLHGGMYFWVAKEPDIGALYVDRFYIVEEVTAR